MADSFSWTAGGSGAWNVASNWFDLTTGSVASAAPGEDDLVTINGPDTGTITITGPAEAAALAVTGGIALDGSFAIDTVTVAKPPFDLGPLPLPATGTLTVNGTLLTGTLTVGAMHLDPAAPNSQIVDRGVVQIEPGAMLSSGTVAVIAGELHDDGGVLIASDTLTLGERQYVFDPLTRHDTSGTLDVRNHASVTVGDVMMTEGIVDLDRTSTLELGTAGTAMPGTVTVDPDRHFYGGPSFTSPTAINAPVLNNGEIIANFDLTDVTNNGSLWGSGSLSRIVNNGELSGSSLSDITGTGTIDAGYGSTSLGSGIEETVNLASSDASVYFQSGITPVPTIAGFSIGDWLDFQGIQADSATFERSGPDTGTLTLWNAGTSVFDVPLIDYDSGEVFNVMASPFDTSVGFACFAAGTLILTVHGEIPVQQIRVGEMVATKASGHGYGAVRRVRRRSMDVADQPQWADWSPVRVAPDAFGPGLPRRALYLSPDHAIYADDVLIPVKYLLNGTTIAQTYRPTIAYWHIELDRHAIVLAEGLPVESYLDHASAASASLAWEAGGCAPLMVTGPRVDAVRRRLQIRAQELADQACAATA